MVKHFTIADWNVIENQTTNEGSEILIPFDEHGIEDPIVQVYMSLDEGLFELVGMNQISHSESNDIILNCDNPFNGKVVIK